MKKILILIITFLILVNIYPDSFNITNIESPKDLMGNEFFPLFVGAKWKWTTEGYGNIKEINWEIVSAHKINYEAKGIKDITAFKIISKEFFEEWYIAEFDGFICYLNEFGEEIIEKKLPLDPKQNDQWNNGNVTYIITEIASDTIMIEYKDDKNIVNGYEVYKKEIGPFKKFENITSASDKREFFMIVSKFTDYKTLIKNDDKTNVKEDPVDEELKTIDNKKDDKAVKDDTQKEEVKKEEIKIDEVKKDDVKKEEVKKEEVKKDETIKKENDNKPRIDDVVIENNLYKIDENDIISNLAKDKYYIQVGAFNIPYYANKVLTMSRDAGYQTKIYRDKDGFYKVLIITSNDPTKIIDDIKKRISKDAFIKKIK